MSNSRSLRELFPCVLGLAFGRLSFTLGSFGSYQSLHEGFGNLEAVGVFALLIAIAVIFFFIYKARLTDAQALLGARIGIISAALVIATGVVIQGSEALRGSFTFFLSLLLSVLAAGVLFYWLRLAKGARSSVAVAYVFSALGLSELILFVLNMLPSSAAAMLTIVLTLGQLPCLAASRQSPPLRDLVFAKGTIGFYDFAPALP